MQICRRCFKTFDTPRVQHDDIGYSYSTCPYCGYDSLATAGNCYACGADIVDGDDYCKDCREAAYKDLNEVWQIFGEHRTFLNLVSDWIEGVS